MLEQFGIARPKGLTVMSKEDAVAAAEKLGYPVLLRPSYVIGGQNMTIAFTQNDIERYMFGVIVYYDNLVTHSLQCPNTMNRRIIKLYTLSYTYRSGTDNDYPLFLAVFYKRFCLVVFFFVISRIKVRRLKDCLLFIRR